MKNNLIPKEMKVREPLSIDNTGKQANDFACCHVLPLLKAGLLKKQIQEKLNLKRKTLEYYLSKLLDEHYIIKIPHTNPAIYEVTKEGETALYRLNRQRPSMGVSPKDFRMHNFSVQLPIISDGSSGFWEKSWDMGNWIKQFRRLQHIGVSVERTTRTLTINFQPRECREENIFPMAMAGTVAVMGYLAKEGIELDLFGARVSRQEYASPEPLVQEQLEKGLTFRQSLGRPQERIMASDIPKPAYVWFDSSKGAERDTNDLAHMRNTALMPERVEQIEKAIQGSVQTLNALANTQMLMAAGWKLSQEKIVRTENRIRNLEQKRIKEFL